MPRVWAGLKKWHEEDRAKARHMLRRRSVDEVVRYMGMPRDMVARIDRELKAYGGTVFERTYMRDRPVAEVRSGNDAKDAWEHAARRGSDALFAAIAKTGVRPK